MTEGGVKTLMETFLTTVGSVFTQIVTWMSTVIGFINDQPMLLIFVLLAICSIVFRMIRKWLPGL